MPKRHHQKTVGMMAVGAPTPTALEETFVSLYLGERDDRRAPYQACNAVQSYGDRQLWGAGPPEGAGRVGRNVEGWIRFLRALQSANRRVGEGNLRAILSRNLMGFRVVRGWSLGEIGEYVGRLCQRILAEELAEQVAGWWLADEGVEKPDHTDRAFREVVATVQTAQKEAGCAFPFFLAEELDSAPYWSRRLFGGWEHRIAPQLISWVETFSEVAAGARLVLMPFYYPWAANQWRSVSLPPPKKWELFFENLNRSFPSERYSFLEFQPILELSQQQKAIPPPAHTDVHRQIRWVWDRPRVSGVWFMGWNQSGVLEGSASRQWTGRRTRRWAEAIQNELGGRQEGLREALPARSELLEAVPDRQARGLFLRFTLAEEASVQLRIARNDGLPVRTLELGDPGPLPPGRYTGTPTDPRDPLAGTAAYWDGRDDSGRQVAGGFYQCALLINGRRIGRVRIPRP